MSGFVPFPDERDDIALSDHAGFEQRKPCTEGGEHCFCATSFLQRAMIDHEDIRCCWCLERKSFSFSREPVPAQDS